MEYFFHRAVDNLAAGHTSDDLLVAYPTVFTMFISGIWHGAGWHFVAFGLLHGFYPPEHTDEDAPISPD